MLQNPRGSKQKFVLILLTILVSCSSIGTNVVKSQQSLTGKLLISAPNMDDPRFLDTVILMVHHTSDGALGLVINKPVFDISSAEIAEGIGLPEISTNDTVKAHFGGPVQPRQVFIIHSTDYLSSSTITLTNGIAVSGDKHTIQTILQGRGPQKFLLIMGYAGWSGGQLEAELARNDWSIAPAESEIVLDNDHLTKWQRAMRQRLIEL